MKHLILSLLISSLCCGTIMSQTTLWSSHTDKSWDPASAGYKISTAGQLARLAALVNGGESFEKVVFTLTNDIDLSGHDWVPIGEENMYPFRGTFNGNGHSIKGLKINNNLTDYYGVYSALFGRLGGNATIQNLTVADGEIKGGMGDGTLTASLVADISPDENEAPVRIINCINKGVKVIAGTGARGGRTGGLIASVKTSGSDIIIDKCSNEANITGICTSSSTGGLIGWILAENKAKVSISNSFNKGKEIRGTKDFNGGLVGRIQANTHADVSLTGNQSHSKIDGGEGAVGGLVGNIKASADSKVIVGNCSVAKNELTGNKFSTDLFVGINENGILQNNNQVSED